MGILQDAANRDYREEWRAAHREHIREYDRKWAAQNREKRAAYDRQYMVKVRLQILEVLGGKCVVCGYNDSPLALDVDHINDDGSEDRKGKSTLQYYRDILARGGAGCQLLCCNCHAIKSRSRLQS